MNWTAIALTFRLASWVCLILLLVGAPFAYWISFSRRHWKFLVEAVVAMPLVLPPTVLGYCILVALGSRSPLGHWYEQVFGHTLPFSFQGLVVASILYSLPFAVQPMATAFALVDRNLINASRVLGAGNLRTFFRIILPLSWGGVLTSAVLSFAHTVGEFGVVLMVGGNIPGVTQTVSISIYDDVEALNYAAAGRTSAALLIFAFALLSIVYAVNRRVWHTLPADLR